MTEVFKTNVNSKFKAKLIRALIENMLPEYAVNFDLDDCDRILRVTSAGEINPFSIMRLMDECGFSAEVLADEIPGGQGEGAGEGSYSCDSNPGRIS